MKLALSALVIGSAAAFSSPLLTVAVKKGAKKPAPKKAAVPKKAAAAPKKAMKAGSAWGPSEALPFSKSPPTLDGSLIGDVGFDPLGFTTVAGGSWFDTPNGKIEGINWYREAELMHGRIAQVAVLGFIWPGVFGTLPGNEWTGVDAYSNINPIEALSTAPSAAVAQIFFFMAGLEFKRVGIITNEGSNYMPGDFKLGQGEGRWNPLKLNYSPEEYAKYQLNEIKHCRLAMLGVFGLWAQNAVSGVSISEQLGGAFTVPEYYAKAGYFLPEGI